MPEPAADDALSRLPARLREAPGIWGEDPVAPPEDSGAV